MKVAVTYFALTCVLFAVNSLAFAVGTIESIPVHFPKRVSSITLEGTLKGDKVVDYTLRAKAGQSMTIMLNSNNLSNYFNILPPGSKDVAFFIGSVEGNEWAGTLPTEGEYKVRVYLMRNAARRSEKANYTMTFTVNGNGTSEQPLGGISSTDVKVEGTEYHATVKVSGQTIKVGT